MCGETGLSAHRPAGRLAPNKGFNFGEAAMGSLSERGRGAARNERVIGSVRDRTGAPLAVVRSLFAQEFSRLELGAKVRSYLAVLTASNVRAILRQKRRMLP